MKSIGLEQHIQALSFQLTPVPGVNGLWLAQLVFQEHLLPALPEAVGELEDAGGYLAAQVQYFLLGVFN